MKPNDPPPDGAGVSSHGATHCRTGRVSMLPAKGHAPQARARVVCSVRTKEFSMPTPSLRLAGAALLAMLCTGTAAQPASTPFPTRLITLISPFPAGGGLMPTCGR